MDEAQIDRALNAALARARRSAASRNRRFDLDIAYLRQLWEDQRGACAVSGLPFDLERHDGTFVKTPFAPSLDRVDNSDGYVRGNVRLVLMATNFAMNQWGEGVLRRLAHGVVAVERSEHRDWYRDRERKLRDAEAAAETMTGRALVRQRHVIAGLKRALTLGPARLSAAGRKAYTATRDQRLGPGPGRR